MVAPISDKMERNFKEATHDGNFADLGDITEKFIIETVASCMFAVNSGAYNGKGQNEFCRKVYDIFVHGSRDFLYMLAMQIPWVKSVFYHFHIPINKPSSTEYIKAVLKSMIEHKKHATDRRNDFIEFMSSAIAQKERKIESQKFDAEEGLSGDEFLMANALALFFASIDTDAITMSHIFYELALNHDVQQKLQANFLFLQFHA